jgi:hypothetical protein
MVKWISDHRWNRLGKSQEFIIIASLAGDILLGHSICSHCPPFIVISVAAFYQPDLRQVFEALVLSDIRWRYMAMVVKNGQVAGELEIELFASWGRKQKVLGEKAILHRDNGIRAETLIKPGKGLANWSDHSLPRLVLADGSPLLSSPAKSKLRASQNEGPYVFVFSFEYLTRTRLLFLF